MTSLNGPDRCAVSTGAAQRSTGACAHSAAQRWSQHGGVHARAGHTQQGTAQRGMHERGAAYRTEASQPSTTASRKKTQREKSCADRAEESAAGTRAHALSLSLSLSPLRGRWVAWVVEEGQTERT